MKALPKTAKIGKHVQLSQIRHKKMPCDQELVTVSPSLVTQIAPHLTEWITVVRS